MSTTYETEVLTCRQCGPRKPSQFRTRAGGRKQSICRRCTALNRRRAKRTELPK